MQLILCLYILIVAATISGGANLKTFVFEKVFGAMGLSATLAYLVAYTELISSLLML